jgi:DNA-binding LacI/PurR family transcriptional regulator
MAGGPLDKIEWSPMYEQVRDRLLKYIEDNDLWGRQLISERQLAEVFGVSRGTVRKGVELLAREGIVSSQVGRRARVLARRKTTQAPSQIIAVATFDHAALGTYQSQILAGIANAAAEIDASLLLVDLRLPEKRRTLFDAVASGAYFGVVLFSMTDRATVSRIVDRSAVPVVLTDHHFPDLPVTGVIDDSEDGARQAVEHLISLGHRRIAYLEVTRREWNPWRFAGYAAALRNAGIELADELVEPAVSFEGALAATTRLLALPDPPTALFAFDDCRAWGAWTAAETWGLRVGADFAIVGYGDCGDTDSPIADLSTVSFSPNDIGRVAVEALGRLRRGEALHGELIRIPVELHVRRSSEGARRAPAAARGGSQLLSGRANHLP